MLLLLVGIIISIPASILTYWGFGLFNQSPWYLFLLVVMFITYLVIYINIYWIFLLIIVGPYKNKPRPGKVNKFALANIRFLSGFLVPLQGIHTRKKNFNLIPKEPSLILFNHVSDFDAWALYAKMKGTYAMVGKKALTKIPVVRCLANSIGTLYVDKDPETNFQMVDDAVDYITNKQTSVVIAPEGTRNFTGQIREFKHGGFNIALRSKCPITFICFKNMEAALKKHTFKVAKVDIEVFDVVKPEEYEGMTAGQLAEYCEKKYKDYLGQNE